MSDTNVHRVVGNLHVGTSHFFVDTTTNQVGVNTSTPGAALDVQGGDVKVGSGITLANDGTITATGGFSGDGSGLSGVNSDSGSWVKDDTNGLIYVANSAHKVGIGTTDPVTPFELVVGTSAAPLTAETTVMQLNSTLDGSSSDHKCYFKFQYVPESNPVNWTDWSGRIQFVTDSTNQGYIEFNPPGAEYAIAFGNTGGGSAAGEIMRLLGTGNVGIGATSPGVKLDVDGDVRLSGLLTLGTHANAPSTTLNGSMYYNTTTNSLNLYKNGWISVSAFLPSDISGLIGWYLPENWNGSTWIDASGSGNNSSSKVGTIQYSASNSSGGATNSFPILYGDTSTKINFPIGICPANYTLIYLTRYYSTAQGRILDSQNNNWLSGHWSGLSGVAYHEGWLTQSTSSIHGSNWVLGVDQNSLFRHKSSGSGWSGHTGGGARPNLRIGSAGYEPSNWMCGEICVFNRHLSAAEYTKITE